MKISLENGKYIYESDDRGSRVLRHGEPWRDVTGDKFIGAMAGKIDALREYIDTRMTENPATWATHGRHLKEIMES